MSATALPIPQRRTNRRWLFAGVLLIIIAIVAGIALTRPSSASTVSAASTSAVEPGTVVSSVAGSGTVAAAQTLDLTFGSTGTVAEVYVKEGDTVTAGQPLAKIDTRDLELQVAIAKTALESAQTKLGQTKDGNIKPQDVSAQQAQVASAQAQLRSAQAQLAALTAPSSDKVATQQSAIQQAEISLQSTRDSASATKTRTEQDMNKSSEALTQAQSKYATAKSNWDYVQETGRDPINPSSTGANGKSAPNTLSDGEQRQYYDQLVQAEAALRSAEQSLTQAQVAFDAARQAEVTSVQSAEAKLADAKQTLVMLQNPAQTDVTQRQAAVQQAQSGVAQAQANLEKLSAPGTESDVAIQNASVTQAEQNVQQAELKLANATMTAPFGGIITDVNIVPGSSASGATAAISLLNRDPLHVDLKLSENDVANVAINQPVTIAIDALKGISKTGTVSYIATAAESSNGVVTYNVRVDFPGDDASVRVGMTANLTIVTQTKDGVLLIPNSALLPKGAGHAVKVVSANGQTITETDVTIGISDGTNTEITSGLQAGDKVLTTPSSAPAAQRTGLFGR